MTVDLLCKVVDNYGDIGVVYRLAKALSALRPGMNLRLVVDRLDVFAALCPAIRPEPPAQTIGNWTIVRWDTAWEGFRLERPRFVIEAFACGRPDWYENLLHDPTDPAPRLHLVLEYLSAEAYADELHLLPSLSPIPQVKKVYFMPGFSAGTGGLVFDPAFMAAKRLRDTWTPPDRENALRTTGLDLPPGSGNAWWLCLFSYEHDYRALVADLAAWQAETGRPVLVLAAAGRSQAGFRAAWESAGGPFATVWLPFLPQETWDRVLLACDASVIRGEESLARAALGGRPFVWHAYLQDEGYQKVKVAALVETVSPCLAPDDTASMRAWQALMAAFNDRTVDSAARHAPDPWLDFLRTLPALAPGFRRFAEKLEIQGDCAAKVLSLIDDFG